MPETYPPTFPQPLLAGYAWEVDMGLLRTPMDGGLSRQRRLYDVMPHTVQLSFTIPLAQLTAWQAWVNQYAYEYVQMDILTWLSNGHCATPHYVRFTTNLNFSLPTKGLINCRVSVELSPAQVSNYNPPPQDLWIIGGSPPGPSPETVIAGTPANPSPDVVIGGTPANPSL